MESKPLLLLLSHGNGNEPALDVVGYVYDPALNTRRVRNYINHREWEKKFLRDPLADAPRYF